MNKYYIPDISEFYIGFEYEHRQINFSEKEDSYIEDSYNKNFVKKNDPLEFIDHEINSGYIRVKFLDKEDIESLGFSNYIPPHEYDHTWTLGNYTLKCWFNNKIPHIRIIDHLVIIFDGVIKNKSELIKLLKQIGINE